MNEFFSYLFPDKKKYAYIAAFIYALNTYSIIIFSGGQIGVMLAYSLVPLVVQKFILVINSPHLFNGLFAGLVLSIQLLFDPRLVYLSLTAIVLYIVCTGINKKIIQKQLLFAGLIPGVILFLLHSYWVLPLIQYKIPALPSSFVSLPAYKFFSFADFPHALSLLHPNWPENIFGKIYFFRPEFILIPVLAYSSLLFINGLALLRRTSEGQAGSRVRSVKNSLINNTLIDNNKILYFSLLGLLGAFMAKGTNEPFGLMNKILFTSFPGMKLFRDPSKWYVVVVLAYSVLIPFSLSGIYGWLSAGKKFQILNFKFQINIQKFYFKNFVMILFIAYWLFTIWPGMTGQLREVFKSEGVPVEYVQLKDFITREKRFFRTFWIPEWQRYGFFSDMNPAIGRGEIIPLGKPSLMASKLKNNEIIEKLKNIGVKYVILPYDSEGELFISDRKYDDSEYKRSKRELDTNPQLSVIANYGKLYIYELTAGKDRFWLTNGSDLDWTAKSATNYEIELKNDTIEKILIFSEDFSPYWRAKIDGYEIYSRNYKSVNSFKIPKGVNIVNIYYAPQKLVNRGLIVSLVTLSVLVIYLYYKRKESK